MTDDERAKAVAYNSGAGRSDLIAAALREARAEERALAMADVNEAVNDVHREHGGFMTVAASVGRAARSRIGSRATPAAPYTRTPETRRLVAEIAELREKLEYAIETEREACALAVEGIHRKYADTTRWIPERINTAVECLEAIRSRGDAPAKRHCSSPNHDGARDAGVPCDGDCGDAPTPLTGNAAEKAHESWDECGEPVGGRERWAESRDAPAKSTCPGCRCCEYDPEYHGAPQPLPIPEDPIVTAAREFATDWRAHERTWRIFVLSLEDPATPWTAWDAPHATRADLRASEEALVAAVEAKS